MDDEKKLWCRRVEVRLVSDDDAREGEGDECGGVDGDGVDVDC